MKNVLLNSKQDIFFSPKFQDWLWGPLNGYWWVLSPKGKVAGV
jgi:hypothetical protein